MAAGPGVLSLEGACLRVALGAWGGQTFYRACSNRTRVGGGGGGDGLKLKEGDSDLDVRKYFFLC